MGSVRCFLKCCSVVLCELLACSYLIFHVCFDIIGVNARSLYIKLFACTHACAEVCAQQASENARALVELMARIIWTRIYLHFFCNWPYGFRSRLVASCERCKK